MSLIARYKFDGNARDSEGSAHGTAIDVTWAPSQLVDGGGEARLNGATSRIETAIQFTTETAVSLPIWFRPRAGVGHLIGQHDGTNGLAIEQTATGKIRLVVGGAASQEVTIYPGEYHHAVAVYDAGTATLYLDNGAVATVTATVTWPAVPVTIGARADGSAALACDVVDVRGYDQVITQEMIYALIGSVHASHEASVNTYNPTRHYPLDEVISGQTFDIEGNNPLIVNGTVTQVDGALEFTGNGYLSGFSLAGVYLDAIRFRFYIAEAAEGIPTFNMIGTLVVSAGFFGFGDIGGAITGETFTISFGATNQPYLYITDPISAGWHEIVVSWDGSQYLIALDGEFRDTLTHNGLMPHMPLDYLQIGKRYSYAQYFTGKIDEILIYTGAGIGLTEQQVAALYAGIDQGSLFPHRVISLVPPRWVSSYNPHPAPVPNPTAIPRSGRSSVQGVSALLAPPAWFDQRDGSGGSHLTPEGVVSRPDRQGRISGNTTDPNGNPVSRRVRCFERSTGRIVREGWSNSAGYYQFDDLDPAKRFTIVAHDHTGEYNAVIADNAQPEVPA